MPSPAVPSVARVAAAVCAVVALAVMLRAAVPLDPGVDYFHDASPAIDALARGDVAGFFGQRPLMGPVSILLRAPVVALVFGESLSVVYFAGVLPCLAALVALIVVLRRRMTALGRPQACLALVVVAGLLNTGVFRAIHWGHPEELLAGALCAGAVLAALGERSVVAGLLLGLAVTTKQWAIVAVVPVLLAAPLHWTKLALVAGAVSLALTLPAVVVAPETFVSVQREAAQARGPIGPANVWWLVASERTAADRAVFSPGFAYEIPSWLAGLTHPLIVLISAPLGLLFRMRRGTSGRADALGLLALLLLLRCLLDPWNNDYYHAPALIALLAWESLTRSGWPGLTLFAGAALALTFPAGAITFTDLSAAGDALAVGYLAWALPLTGWVALNVFAPARARALAAAARARLSDRRTRAANVARV